MSPVPVFMFWLSGAALMSADLSKINPIRDKFNIFLHFYGVRLNQDQRPQSVKGRQRSAIVLLLLDALVRMLAIWREPQAVLFPIIKEIE